MILSNPDAATAIEILRENISGLQTEIDALTTIKSALEAFVAKIEETAAVRLNLNLLTDDTVVKIAESLSLIQKNVKEIKTMEELNKANEQIQKLIDRNMRIEHISNTKTPLTANSLLLENGFRGWVRTNFVDCFSLAYVYLENIKKDKQENSFILFDFAYGRSALRPRFDGEPSKMQMLLDFNADLDSHIDFLFGYAGYGYKKLTDANKFKNAVIASINEGKPVIAKTKDQRGNYRIITGYNGDDLILPTYKESQKVNIPLYSEIEALYTFGDKIKPRYTFKDALKRVKMVMESNLFQNLWEEYINKMGVYLLHDAGIDEAEKRLKRIHDSMFFIFNCHYFAEVFRNKLDDELNNPAFDFMCGGKNTGIIDRCYNSTHDLAWSLIYLNNNAKLQDCWQLGEIITLALRKIKQNDVEVLDAINKAIDILEA